jgi:hypothetical protein
MRTRHEPGWKSGFFSPQVVWRVIRTTVSLFVGMVVFHVFLAPEFPFDEEEIEQTVEILLHGIGGGTS